VHIGPFLISHAKTAKLIQPCDGTLYDPAPSAEAATMFRITHRKLGHYGRAKRGGCAPRRRPGPLIDLLMRDGLLVPGVQFSLRWTTHAFCQISLSLSGLEASERPMP